MSISQTKDHAPRRMHSTVSTLFVLALVGCGAGQAPGGLTTPEGRPSDGLLSDAELQAVVDVQVQRAWEPLVDYLSHERAEVRARAAMALASVQAPEAVPHLAGLLDDPDVGVRRDAALALGQSAQRFAAGPIFEALQVEADPTVRHRLIEALGKIGFEEVLQGLVDLDVSGADQVDRLLAMARLGAIQGVVNQGSLNELMANLDDDDADIRLAAAYFFGRSRDPGQWSPRVARIRQALDGYGSRDLAAMHLVKALARLNVPGDMQRLSGLAMSATDWRVRTEAMVGLAGRELDDSALDALLAGLDDASIHVAVSAANTLAGRTHLPSILGRLANWVDDEIRVEIGLRALGQMRGEEALRRLQVAVSSESDRIAAAAMMALRQRWGADEADQRLHALYFDIFSMAVASQRPPVVSAAAPVLAGPAFASFGNTQVLIDAMAAAALPAGLPIVQIILNSLGQTGDPAVAEVFRAELEHPYAAVRRTAVRALGQHFGEEVELPEGGLETPGESASASGADPSRIDWGYLADLGASPRLVLETERGALVIRMSTEEAPHTVQTMARLAQQGRFDGTPFHRVVPNFVIQGGDVERGDGRGGPGFSITTEVTSIPYERGVIGMASSGKDTEGSQFFLVHSAQPHLDGGYTAFGWLVEGAEALDGVAQGDVLLSAHVEPGG